MVSWHPLLSGDEADQALAAVEEIARATSRAVESCPGNVGMEAFSSWQNSLDGRAGQSLLHAYLALHRGGGGIHADTAIDLLDQATDSVAALRMPPSLYFGFSGIVWVTAHLTGLLFEESEDSCLAADELLLRSLSGSSWVGRFDLFEGLVGIGVYAMERLPYPSAVAVLEGVVSQLAANAEHDSEGASFFSPLDTLKPGYGEIFPHGTYNLGMAHGLAGVIALLGSACQAGVATGKARPLLEATISWLLARERPANERFRFLSTYSPRSPATDRGRLAWCHGDLGIAVALLGAARGVGETSWEGVALRVARAAADISAGDAGVPDAELCHGAAGIGHLFNRLFQATGEPKLGEAATRWLRQALAAREPGIGVGGYRMVQKGDWFDQPGFRIGSSGIGMALLASVSRVEPSWDRLLLVRL